MKLLLKFAVAGALVAGSTVAQAADKLTFYCSAQEDWCQLMTKEFSAATGIKEVAIAGGVSANSEIRIFRELPTNSGSMCS